ncbi:MAG: ferritin-like domain-containing protein [Solirubrobacteraceae bacterium]
MSPERIPIADGNADTAQVAEFERGRRELLRRGFGLGGALITASSIPLLLSVRNAFAAASGDMEILEQAIGLERVAVLAYGEVIDGGLLSTRFTRIARRLRDHEQEHADALASALTDLGGTPPKEPTVKDIDGVVEGIGDLRSQGDVANFAIELELAAVAAYYDAHSKLVDAKLLQTGASIMANEAQHLVVLRQSVKRPPVPNAFETGKQ